MTACLYQARHNSQIYVNTCQCSLGQALCVFWVGGWMGAGLFPTHPTHLKHTESLSQASGRSLLYTCVILYHRYLFDDQTGSGNKPVSDLVWVHAQQWEPCWILLHLTSLFGSVLIGTTALVVIWLSPFYLLYQIFLLHNNTLHEK